MLRTVALLIAFCIIILVASFVCRKHARTILWSSGLTLFVGTLILIGLGVVEIERADASVSDGIWCCLIAIATGTALIICAESLKKRGGTRQAAVAKLPFVGKFIGKKLQESSIELPEALNTETARMAFDRAIKAGYITIEDGHYKWNEAKVLLCYLCGRIYCGDYPEFYEWEDKTIWRFGKQDFFPNAELIKLFKEKNLSTSRLNRKDLPVPLGAEKIDGIFEK